MSGPFTGPVKRIRTYLRMKRGWCVPGWWMVWDAGIKRWEKVSR